MVANGMRTITSVCLVVALIALSGCGSGPTPDSAAAEGSANSRAERYVAFSMDEMHDLGRRVCRRIPARVLARKLGDAGSDGISTEPNDVALGFVSKIDISPIPLQRAAYNGCVRGVKRQQR